MKLKQLGYGLSAVALTASILPVGSVFAENEACTEDFAGDTCVAADFSELSLGLKNKNVKTINILNDIAAGSAAVFSNGKTINGNNKTFTTTHTMGVSVATSEPVVINDWTITATGNDSKAIQIYAENMPSYDLTLNGATVQGNKYGIIDFSQYYGAKGNKLTITDSKLQWVSTDGKTVANVGEDLADRYAYGIYSYGLADSAIEMSGSEITGYRYANSLWYSAEGGSYVIKDSYISGRTAFDSFAKATEEKPFNVEITNSTLNGINNFNGGSENYANIILDYNSEQFYAKSNHLKLTDVTFTVYENAKGLASPTSNQYATTSRVGDVADSNCSIDIYGDTTYLVSEAYKEAKTKTTYPQTTPFLEDAMYKYMTAEDTGIVVYGGTYSYDPSLFVAEGYKAVKEDNAYTVYPLVTELTLGDGEEEVELMSGESQALRINYAPENAVAEFEVTTDKPELFDEDSLKIAYSNDVPGVVFSAASEGTGEATVTVTEKNSGKTASVKVKVTEVLKSDSAFAEDGTWGTVYFETPIEGDNLAVEIASEEITDEEMAKISPFLKAVYDISVVDQDTDEVVPVKDNRIDVMLILDAADYEGMNYFKVVYIDEDSKLAEAFDTERLDAGEDKIALAFTTTHLSSYGVLASETEFPEVLTPDTGAFTAETGSKVAGVAAVAVAVAIITMAGVAIKLSKR